MDILKNLCSLIVHRYNFLPQDNDTIVSFESPHRFNKLYIAEPNSDLIPDYPIDQQLFHIRMVNSAGQREAASLLVKKRYSWRGYCVDTSLATEPNQITLIAETAEETVGTMTLCFDGDSGLPADENFRDQLDELRAQGRRISEPSRLAIDDNVPKRVFAALSHICYIYACNIHGFTDYVIEVNPRHAIFYKRMLGFKEIGAQRICTRVGAPAVLLRLKLEYMDAQIRRFGGLMEQHGKERSFYPYFFSKKDEQGITKRLRNGRNWTSPA
jgi:hypothetical protein